MIKLSHTAILINFGKKLSMNKITQLSLILTLIIFASCDDSKATFEIQKNKVGPIEATTEINQLDVIFAKDSIVKPNLEDRFRSSHNDIYIYHKESSLSRFSRENLKTAQATSVRSKF